MLVPTWFASIVLCIILLFHVPAIAHDSANVPAEAADSLLLVSTIDGGIHAIDARTGQSRWLPLLTPPLVSSFTSVHDARNRAASSHSSAHQSSFAASASSSRPFSASVEIVRSPESGSLIQDESEIIIPGLDGTLFVGRSDQPSDLETNTSVVYDVERLPITAREIVDAAPFQAADGTRFIASKEANIMVIDRNTGMLRRALAPKSHMFDSCFEDKKPGNEQCSSSDPKSELWLTRVELIIHAIDAHTGHTRWNVSISEYTSFTHPGSFQSDLQSGKLLLPLLAASVDGSLVRFRRSESDFAWARDLRSPIAAVFVVAPGSSDMLRVPHVFVEQSEISDLIRHRRAPQNEFEPERGHDKFNNAMDPAGGHGVFVGAQSDGSLFALSNQFSPSRVVAAAALASAKNTTESVKGIGQRSDIQVEENTGEDGTDADEEPDQEEHEESPDPQVDQPGSESDLENSESAVDELSESEIEGDADEADASKPRSAASERARERRLIRTAFAPGSWTHSDMFMPGSRSAKLRDTGLWLTALPTAIAQSKATNSAGLRAALLPWTRINVSLRDGDNVIGLQRQNSEFAGTDSYLGFHFMPFGETRSVRLGAIDLYYAAQSKRQMEQPHLSSRWLPLPPDWVPADVDDYGELPLGLPNPQDIISRNLRDVPLSIAPPEPTPSWHPLWIVAASALGTVVVVWLTRRFLSSGVVAPASVSNSSTTALSSGRTQRHVDATGREVVSIGKISYFPSAVLGLGSHGTMVYEGALDGRPIAVKRLLAAFVEAAQQEMSLLIATDQHPNVLRYHAFEQDGDFVYVALEQCHGALAALFERECPTSLIPSGFFDQRVEVWVAHMPNSSAVTVSHAFHPSSLCASAKQFPSLWERSQNDVLICSSQALALLVDSATESLKTPLSNDEISNEAVAEPDNSSQHSEGSSSESDSEENSAPRFVSPPPGLPAAVSWRDKASATSSIAAPSKTGDIAMTSPLRSATAGRRGGRIQRGRGGHRKPAEPAIRPVEPVLPPAPKPIFVVPEHWPRQRQLLYPSPACVRLLRETMAGVAFLHGLNIVHRDIKPQNLLLAGATHVAKIADMGLGKKLSAQSSSFGGASSFGMRLRTLAGQHPDQRQSESSSMMVSPAGSAGWIAPEMLQEKSARLTKAVDIFSLGCVFHFTITGGLHPFGGRVERDSNIIRSRVNLSELELMPEAHDLIASMLLSDPSQRPSASECLAHPFFWNDSERMTFLETVSDYLEAEPQDSALRAAVEGHACTIVSGNWEARLDAALLDNLGKHRKYDFGSAIDCLRLIRNKKHHFHDLPLDVQAQLGPLPSGFVRFFLAPERFPRLLLFLWQVLAANLPVADASPLHRFLGAVSERTRARLRDELQIQHRRWWPAFPLNCSGFVRNSLQNPELSSIRQEIRNGDAPHKTNIALLSMTDVDAVEIDSHPITGEQLRDDVGYESDDAAAVVEPVLPSGKSTMLSSLLESGQPVHFPEWDSLPAKYLVSDAKSYLAYFKAFIGAGILFLPSAIKDGGLSTSIVTFIITTILSTLCMVKMVEAKRRIVDDFKAGDFHGVTKPRKIISFGMLGRIATGSRYGRWIVDISIATSQLCFGTSALIFTSKNLREVIHQLGNCTDKYDYSASTLIWIVAPLLIPSMFVRQLSKFAVYILIADFFIVAGLLYLYASDVSILSNSGVGPGIIQFDGLGFWSLLATAIYALEGTSFVLPIEHAMENKQNFHRVTYISGFAIGAIYMSFGVLGYLAYGSNISSIITLNLKHDNPHSTPAIMLQLAYCLALLVSFPVTLFPPVRLAEAALFPLTYGPDGQKLTNSKLTWSKNLVRSLLTLLCAVMAIAGGASFSSFIALVGGLMCVPLTLTFPAYFHLKICGDRCSTRELWEDYICVTVGMIGTVACTAIAIYQIFTATATPDYPCVPQ